MIKKADTKKPEQKDMPEFALRFPVLLNVLA